MALYCVICNILLEHPQKKVCANIICKRKHHNNLRRNWSEKNPEKIKKFNEDRRKREWLKKGFSEPPPKKVYPKRIYEDNNVDDLAILNRCRASAGLRPLSEMPMVRHYADQGPKQPEKPVLPMGKGNKKTYPSSI